MFNMREPGGNIPAFLMKLWNLLENQNFQDLVCWDKTGTSFHVYDQSRFAHEVLPHYFKHNNISSFIRQLNMYGFRKMTSIDQGALKMDRDEVEFSHQFFQREHPELLEFIKRKLPNSSTERHVKVNPEDVSLVLSDVTALKNKQETMDSRLESLKRENQAVWSELANLRRKYDQQTQVLNKLVRFLMSTMARKPTLGMKRKYPQQLMLSDMPASSNSSPAKRPTLTRPISLDEGPDDLSYSVESPLDQAVVPAKNGPIIHDVTDLLTAPSPNGKNEEYLPVKTEGSCAPPCAYLGADSSSQSSLPFTPGTMEATLHPVLSPSSLSPSTSSVLSPVSSPNAAAEQAPQEVAKGQFTPPDLPSLRQTPPASTLASPGKEEQGGPMVDMLLPSVSNTVSLPVPLTQKVKEKLTFGDSSLATDFTDHLESMDINLESLRDFMGQQFPHLENDLFSGIYNFENTELPLNNRDENYSESTLRGADNFMNDLGLPEEQNPSASTAGNELMQYSGSDMPSLFDSLDSVDLSFPLGDDLQEPSDPGTSPSLTPQ